MNGYSLIKQKIFSVVIVFLSITLLAGCDRTAYYQGEDLDLYSVAVNSLLGVNGYGGKGSRPKIEVIEEDSFGRKLFSYVGDGLGNSYNLLICQKSDDKYAYYYPDFNFISAAYNLINVENIFTIEEVNKLKELNDWDKEINEEKSVKVEIKHKKDQPMITNDRKNQFELIFKEVAKETGYKGNDSIFRYAIYCTSDYYGRTLYYAYGIGRDVNGEGVSPSSLSKEFELVIIFKIDETFVYMELLDEYEYQAEVNQLKDLSNWNQP
jgi:hypothetical protein